MEGRRLALRGRPRRGALGLRGRIVGAVMVTTSATLVVAALVLLPRLEDSLRHVEVTTLGRDLGRFAGRDPTQPLASVNLGLIVPASATKAGRDAIRDLVSYQRNLATKLGVHVNVLTLAGGSAVPLLPITNAADPSLSDAFGDAATAFRTGRTQRTFGTIDGTEYARIAIPFSNHGQPYVLAVRRSIDEVAPAVHVVQTAVLTAALAGLALTMILAIPLSATLVRRLRRLRQATLQVAEGDLNAHVPQDRARDEVGDLTRSFETMQRRLNHQEQARRAFVATASHELRTPLASLDGMLELLEEDLRSGEIDPADALALLGRARVQSRRLGRLAADLLDLSRIDAEVRLRSEPVELGELSRAVMAEFELGTAERRIQLALDDSCGPVWALGDPGSVARIQRILLDNAVRVSPPGSLIRVELGNGAAAWLSVEDEGPGVPPDERELIFDRFQRGREASPQGGFGLGLAIGRELAGRMRGELVLEDSESQVGARFTLRLPVARAPDQERVRVG